jgi:zinc protease
MVDPGLWSVDAVLVKPEDMTEVKNEIEGVLNKLKTQPIDATELEQAKSHIKYQFAMGIDSPDAIANSLAGYIWLTGDPESVNKAYANYEKITAEDIMDVAKRYFVDKHLTVSTISADEEFVEPETIQTK